MTAPAVTRDDLALLAAAVSLCTHAPARLKCAHMAAPLADLARRLAPLAPADPAA